MRVQLIPLLLRITDCINDSRWFYLKLPQYSKLTFNVLSQYEVDLPVTSHIRSKEIMLNMALQNIHILNVSTKFAFRSSPFTNIRKC